MTSKSNKVVHKNLTSSYPQYKKTHSLPVKEKDFVIINKLYNKFLISKCLEGIEVSLPANMGSLCIQGKKRNPKFKEGKITGLPVDWAETKKLWERNPEAGEQGKKIYHTNYHTDGVTYKFFWSKKNVLAENKILYNLVLSRHNKRMAAQVIKKDYQKFKTV